MDGWGYRKMQEICNIGHHDKGCKSRKKAGLFIGCERKLHVAFLVNSVLVPRDVIKAMCE